MLILEQVQFLLPDQFEAKNEAMLTLRPGQVLKYALARLLDIGRKIYNSLKISNIIHWFFFYLWERNTCRIAWNTSNNWSFWCECGRKAAHTWHNLTKRHAIHKVYLISLNKIYFSFYALFGRRHIGCSCDDNWDETKWFQRASMLCLILDKQNM